MEEAFGTVLIVIVVAATVVALVTFVGAGRVYERIGKGDFALDQPDRPSGPEPGSAAAQAEAAAEIRQMVEAKSARREARGESALDVEAEIAALTRPVGADAALRDEVRQLVIARNERRQRRGEEPLDVEEEVDRQLRDLGA
ncbi:MAG TPA: hypothetical protein VF712_11425 [Thermoleophilaceae bacterium]